MIDLHIHLDGSLTAEELLVLARTEGIRLPAETLEGLRPFLTVPSGCGSLNDYLRCFETPLAVLQSPEAVEYAAASLAERLREQGLLYAEIRFAPQLHQKNGHSQEAIVEAAIRGLRRSGLPGQLILCCMRGADEAANMDTLRVSRAFLGQGVAALDLAGAEGLYPTRDYLPLFSRARQEGLPFTIHAGEAAGPDSVWAALEAGAARIGHGVRAAEDPALTAALARRGIPLEMCPTSNFQTGAAAPGSYPLKAYLDQGIPVTLNTDNTTVSGTTLAGEYALARERLGMTEADERTLLENAARAAFLPEAEKAALLARMRDKRTSFS